MLDVAAVAERLMLLFSFDAGLRDALVLLIALHDLGKVGAEFRGMLLDGERQITRHWEVSEALLRANDTQIGARLGSNRHARQELYAAIAGHHGRPPAARPDDLARMLGRAGEEASRDASAVVAAFADLWPRASLGQVMARTAKDLSWWLSGLVVAADWVGSNPEWFPPREPDLALADYLSLTRGQAERAVVEAGLDSAKVKDAQLFDFVPRPMQRAAADIPLPDGPMLAVIEDETGAGKTEAALILAQRMMLAGKGRGLFFALPTMATADAMFARAVKVMGRLFTSAPSVTLAHGRAGLSQPFRDLVGRSAEGEDDVTCAPWLADNRRRALLADVGIGTVDQVLLAVLPTKFATLRLWGLSSKILIVDEVHELGDPYMGVELAQLLRAHAMRGGSAILMTATLPLDQRAKLVAAFEEGAGRAVEQDFDPAYPSLSVAGGAVSRDFPRTSSARGQVTVRRLEGAEAALGLLVEAATRGAACVWVRNAVDDAIAAVAALRARGVDAALLHARFALCDRKAVEADMLRCFGREGEGRAGRVLVATQVVESSLDLDFDVMVSDLAPIAALIQRAGRLWRHMDLRPAAIRPAPEPVLHVVSPDPARVETARWLHEVLDRGAWVYPLADQWRTADVLFRAGQIDAPSGLRALIESVHGADISVVPPVLESAELDQIGAGYAAANRGQQNIVRLEEGYRSGGGSADDTDYPTRLGEPQRALLLARRRGGGLVLWADGQSEQLSELQAAKRRLEGLALPDQTAAEILTLTREWPEWKRKSVTVCPVEEDGAICEGLRYEATSGLLFAAPPVRG